jgi:Na+/proline symporter
MESYFVAERKLPWWALGFSAAATYTSSGTASGFTMLVFGYGLLGNGIWWIPYGIWIPLAAIIWSRLWRRAGVVTTAQLLEIRYSGKVAAVFRGVHGVYMCLGFAVLLNGYINGWLAVALSPITGWAPEVIIFVFTGIAAIYCIASGLYGVVFSDIPQFLIFLLGNIIFIPVVLISVGGLGAVYEGIPTPDMLKPLPPGGELVGLTILALIVQGLFYVGSPCGGEGYTAQRFMSAKNEYHAQLGQMLNGVITLIIRVIPFIFLGLIGAVVYQGMGIKGGAVWGRLLSDYSFVGLTGLLVAGEIAAYMSTIDTHLNWGASYLVNDMYRRFFVTRRGERHYVLISRLASLGVLGLSIPVGIYVAKGGAGMEDWFKFINNVMVAFILPLGWLRFFWWRLNIYGEAAGILLGLPLAYLVWFVAGYKDAPLWEGFFVIFGLGAATILVVTLLTPPEKRDVLERFYAKCSPPGLWGPIKARVGKVSEGAMRGLVVDSILAVGFFLGLIGLVTSMFALDLAPSLGMLVISLGTAILLVRRWKRRGVFEKI